MLKIYVADITPLYDTACYRQKMELMHEKRREKILKFRSEGDRCRGLAAGLLLREALLGEGISYDDAVFTLGVSGKPRLSDAAVSFNLSHAGKRAVCAVSDHEVGVDIERLSRFEKAGERVQRIAHKILSARERELWENNSSSEELVRLWTKKESYAKLTGEGIACDFSEIDTAEGAFYQEREVTGGYYVSVCTGLRSDTAQWVTVDLKNCE